jgi:hypothetical protein
MLGISVVPLNLRRTLESIPLGLLQFVCETNNITTPGEIQIECYNNSTQSSKKKNVGTIPNPNPYKIHCKLIEEEKKKGKKKRGAGAGGSGRQTLTQILRSCCMRLNFLIRFLTTSRLTKGVTIVASTNNPAGAADHSRPRALSLSLPLARAGFLLGNPTTQSSDCAPPFKP